MTVNGTFFNAAVGSATPTPVTLGNQRVGGTGSQLLTVSNTAAAGAFSEALNASFGANTGAATNNGGSVGTLIAGGSNAALMSVGVNTGDVGRQERHGDAELPVRRHRAQRQQRPGRDRRRLAESSTSAATSTSPRPASSTPRR